MKRVSISITILLLAAACQASPVGVAADLGPAHKDGGATQGPSEASATQTDSTGTALGGMGMGSGN